LGSLGTCLANPPERPFKPFVSEMLRILELETHSGVVPPRSLEFSTSAQGRSLSIQFRENGDYLVDDIPSVITAIFQA